MSVGIFSRDNGSFVAGDSSGIKAKTLIRPETDVLGSHPQGNCLEMILNGFDHITRQWKV